MICLPYILLITIFAVCAYEFEYVQAYEKKIYFTATAIIVFFIFFGFRGYVGTDWLSYSYILEKADWSDFKNWALDFDDDKIREPGFLFLMLICKSIYNDYFFLVFVCMAIDTFLLLRFLKKMEVENIAFALMVFSTFGGPELLFNLLRNALSLLIFLNGLEYINSRKPIPYFLICALALTFHFSALIFFPLYFFMHYRLNKWFYAGFFIAVVCFYLSKTSLLSLIVSGFDVGGVIGGRLEYYTDYYSGASSIRLLTIFEHFILVFFVVWLYDEIIEKKENRIILINGLLIFLTFYYVLAEFLTMSHRMSLMFYFPYWILWMDIIHTLYLKHNKQLMLVVFYLYCVIIQIGNFHEQTAYYDNILFGHKSYKEREKIYNMTFEEFGKQ